MLPFFDTPVFDYVVMNPSLPQGPRPNRWSRRLVETLGVGITNLYTAFLALAVRLLKDGGQLVAITPRSFANGPYFKTFRRDFLSQMSFRRVHLYDSRDSAFSEADVLQENVVFHAVKEKAPTFSSDYVQRWSR